MPVLWRPAGGAGDCALLPHIKRDAGALTRPGILSMGYNPVLAVYKPNENLSICWYTTLAMLSTMMPAVHTSRLARV